MAQWLQLNQPSKQSAAEAPPDCVFQSTRTQNTLKPEVSKWKIPDKESLFG